MQTKAKLRTKYFFFHTSNNYTCIDKNIYCTSMCKETTIDVYETLQTNC